MRSIWLKAVILLLILTVSSVITLNNVSAQTSPDIEISISSCYSHIYEADDLYCAVVYELPTYTSTVLPISTPEAWCNELVNKNGCTDNPVNPTEPTSLTQNSVFITLEDSTLQSLAGINTVRRIGFGVGGVYLAAGHNVTFADPNLVICITSNEDIYTTANVQKCVTPTWNSLTKDFVTQRTALGEFFKAGMIAKGLNEARSLNYYMTNDKINLTGSFIVEEALPHASVLLPETFTSSFSGIVVSTPTPVATKFENTVANANPNVQAFFNDTSEELSITSDGLRIGVSIGVAIVSFILGYVIFKDIIFAVIVMNAGLITAMPFDLVYMPGYFAMLAIVALFAAAFMVRRLVGSGG